MVIFSYKIIKKKLSNAKVEDLWFALALMIKRVLFSHHAKLLT